MFSHTTIMLPTEPTWLDISNAIAAWFTAFGTVGAVILTLYLSLKSTRPKLKVEASVQHAILCSSIGTSVSGEYFHVRATNVGLLSCQIISIEWRISGEKRFGALQVMSLGDEYVHSDPLPHRLEHGESARFYIKLEDWLKTRKDVPIAPTILNTRKALNRLRLVVFTSTGHSFSCQPPARLLDDLWESQQSATK